MSTNIKYAYPYPSYKRKNYVLLSDGWTLNGKEISLPFPPQSSLSLYGGEIGKRLEYNLNFTVSDNFYPVKAGKKAVLKFGAVDQIAEIYLNGKFVFKHEGGYLPFEIDVTEILEKENSLLVVAFDALDKTYPYGKQKKKPGGMWYTEVSGVWQSVVLEEQGKSTIKSVYFTPEQDGVNVKIDCEKECLVIVTLPSGKAIEEKIKSEKFVKIPSGEIELWSPDSPRLYSVKILSDNDEVETYFALRTIEKREVNGKTLVFLNGKPIFLSCVLDQGYFEKGIFLPENADEWEKDVDRMKSLGFNCIRKHIKIEPQFFYEACDRKGMLVIQDMVNSGDYRYVSQTVLPTIGLKFAIDKKIFSTKRREFFIRHAVETVKHLYNHPSIFCWTIFNEGWGQFNSDKVYGIIKTADKTRLIDSTSGWFKQKKSDFLSEHIYFHNRELKGKKGKILFLSECGGYGRLIADHARPRKNYGYGKISQTEEELTEKFVLLVEKMLVPSLKNGLSGFVYTQLSDIEDEINGLYTYDREVLKINREKVKSTLEYLNGEFLKANGFIE